MRNRDSILLEFEQLLNLLFATHGGEGMWRWKQAPYLRAMESFCRDAVPVVSSTELRQHATREWMRKKKLNQNSDVHRSVQELLNTTLTPGN